MTAPGGLGEGAADSRPLSRGEYVMSAAGIARWGAALAAINEDPEDES